MLCCSIWRWVAVQVIKFLWYQSPLILNVGIMWYSLLFLASEYGDYLNSAFLMKQVVSLSYFRWRSLEILGLGTNESKSVIVGCYVTIASSSQLKSVWRKFYVGILEGILSHSKCLFFLWWIILVVCEIYIVLEHLLHLNWKNNFKEEVNRLIVWINFKISWISKQVIHIHQMELFLFLFFSVFIFLIFI